MIKQLKNLLRRKPKVGSNSKDNSNGASSSLPGTTLKASKTGQEQSAIEEESTDATKDFGNTQGQTIPIQEKRASLTVIEEKESIQKATNQSNSSMTHKWRETSSRGAMFEDTFASEGEETVDSHPLWCSETDEGETDIKPVNTSSSSSPFAASEEDYDDEEPEENFAAQRELVGYTLISKIGQGAFSEVYRAKPIRDSSNPVHTSYKQVAVKVINKKKLSISEGNTRPKKNDGNASSKPTSREQVLKEIMIHKIVSSGENIVTFIDFKETESQYYIVQELLQGGEIFGEIVRLTYFSEDLARHVIRQLAVAVKHMHSLGIVHRDIKPENLLFEPIDYIPSKKQKLRKSDDPRTKKDEGLFRPGVGGGGIGVVKLADFGLSKQIFSTNTTTPCGTVGYTAPEVVKDERYSTKVDMWGIGCVLYTVLCGFPPFYDEKIDTLTELISKGQYTFLRPWWDEISDGAKNAVRCLLEVDPDKRYDIDEFLNDPWLNSYDLTAEMELNRRRRHHTHNHTRKVYKKDSSLLYSPAAVAMRDAFDISNAVQREEEAKRITSGGHNLGALRELDEETTSSPFQNVEQQVFQLSLDSSTIIKRRNMNKAAAQ